MCCLLDRHVGCRRRDLCWNVIDFIVQTQSSNLFLMTQADTQCKIVEQTRLEQYLRCLAAEAVAEISKGKSDGEEPRNVIRVATDSTPRGRSCVSLSFSVHIVVHLYFFAKCLSWSTLNLTCFTSVLSGIRAVCAATIRQRILSVSCSPLFRPIHIVQSRQQKQQVPLPRCRQVATRREIKKTRCGRYKRSKRPGARCREGDNGRDLPSLKSFL